MFALPIQIGAIRLGVTDLYRRKPSRLDQGRLADALLLADTACAFLLDAGPPEPSHTHGDRLGYSGLRYPEVHQATGMVIAQLGVSAAVALIRLRAYAYAHQRLLHEFARDVVARRLRFGAEPGDQP